ncbi:response regulator transcription factor [Micromonospora sp. WMMA1363]|uniref:response regulator transcription factor n=1 Tax=Micromonospora sp. WMMA1363 TaxID=3053985 RepID=UPI00259CE99D|nr:response regulator transcription factor [Micromonospora sp. WMMA1363]MDM4721400.1 response regulator transcription factor [Micromonospora sp. WMMA1363]
MWQGPMVPMPTILVAEDDPAIRRAVEQSLLLEGYQVVAAGDGLEAVAAVRRDNPDLLVLDMMMPGLDGLAVCRVLRAQGDRTPILVLTARTLVSDRVAGLDAGADDYLVKPFEPEELLARLRALLRRAAPGVGPDNPAGDQLETAGVRLDPSARRAWRCGAEITLSRTEFDLLELLMRNRGVVLDRATIHERIWGYDFGAGSKNLSVFISYLRRKLAHPNAPEIIHTVRGVGYTIRAS